MGFTESCIGEQLVSGSLKVGCVSEASGQSLMSGVMDAERCSLVFSGPRVE